MIIIIRFVTIITMTFIGRTGKEAVSRRLPLAAAPVLLHLLLQCPVDVGRVGVGVARSDVECDDSLAETNDVGETFLSYFLVIAVNLRRANVGRRRLVVGKEAAVNRRRSTGSPFRVGRRFRKGRDGIGEEDSAIAAAVSAPAEALQTHGGEGEEGGRGRRQWRFVTNRRKMYNDAKEWTFHRNRLVNGRNGKSPTQYKVSPPPYIRASFTGIRGTEDARAGDDDDDDNDDGREFVTDGDDTLFFVR